MLKDITLGQYYPTESVIHRLDPRVKLVATLMYIVSLFLFHDFVGFIVVTLFLIAIIRMSHVPFSFMLKGVRAIWLLVVITAVCNLFFTQGAQTYFAWKFIHITDTGVSNAVYFTPDGADKTPVKVDLIVANTTSQIIIQVPNLPDGQYLLSVTTQAGSGYSLVKEPRTYQFPILLTVGNQPGGGGSDRPEIE